MVASPFCSGVAAMGENMTFSSVNATVEPGPGVSGSGVGESRFRNSLLGLMRLCRCVLLPCCEVRNRLSVPIKLPLRFVSALGSMLLRLRWPPRGTVAVSTA